MARTLGLAMALTIGVVPALLVTSSSTAATIGVGDITDALRYGPDNRVIGEVSGPIQDSDDNSYLIEAPWPMNFFGRKFDGLCVTSNGTISPVVYDEADCDNSYDRPLANLGESANSPVIAAFANDNDLGNTVRAAERTVSGFTVTGDPTNSDSVVTITTSTAHGLTSGDRRSIYVIDSQFNNGNEDDTRTDEYWYENVAVTVVSTTQFTFSGDTAKNADGTFTPVYPAAVKSSTVEVDQGWVWSDASPDLNGVDDGVGKVNTVYVGTTTVDGRDAWVYTNYRSVTFEDLNPKILTNTFQIVLVKRTTFGGDTRGYDFDIEYNYGAMKDGGDGYSAEGVSCSDMNSACRTGVGLVDWDPVGEVANVFELFGSTPGRDLVDGHTTSMTSNRLNSTINGRYTFRMVGGAVQEFAVPVMDGTGTTEDRPEPEDPLAPVPEQQTQNAGDSALTVDGVTTPIVLDANASNDGIVGTAGDLVFQMAGLDPEGLPLPLDSDGNLILNADGLVDTGGEGFAADSPVKVYLFSDPTFLGTLFTDPTGTFSGLLQIPAGIDPGVHNLQVVGYDPDGNVLVFTVGVVVPGSGGGTDGYGGDSLLASTGTELTGTLSAAGLALIAAGTVLVVRRRKAAQVR
jgi:LPXTG-motif cell wall-anchored protein